MVVEDQSHTDATIIVDTLCIRCRYNLKTLPENGRCPECGLPVVDTLTTFVASRWIGALIIAVSICISFLVLFSTRSLGLRAVLNTFYSAAAFQGVLVVASIVLIAKYSRFKRGIFVAALIVAALGIVWFLFWAYAVEYASNV